MVNNRHKNRRALIVRLDKVAEDSVFVDDGIEGLIIAVDQYMRSSEDFYSGEVLACPEDANVTLNSTIGVRGTYTVLFSRGFKDNEWSDGWSYGESRI